MSLEREVQPYILAGNTSETAVKAFVAKINQLIKDRGKGWSAQPIAFCKIDEDELQITVVFNKESVTRQWQITVTTDPQKWEWKHSGGNWDQLAFGGTVFYFGTVQV